MQRRSKHTQLALSVHSLSGFLDGVDVRKIRPSKHSLRNTLGSLEELTHSIREKGLLQPIVIRPLEDGFEVVAGNRRLEVCRKLKIRKITCHVVEMSDKEAFEVSLVENIQRETLDPVDEAEAFRRYVGEHGYGGVSELARRIGKSEQYVSHRIQLLRLPKNVLEKLSTRVVTPSHARELVGLEETVQGRLAELIVEENLSSREVRRIVKKVKTFETVTVFPSWGPNTYGAAQLRLRRVNRALAKCIACLKVALLRFDDALDHLNEDDWVVMEVLMYHRRFVHRHIDSLLKLKRRIERGNPPT